MSSLFGQEKLPPLAACFIKISKREGESSGKTKVTLFCKLITGVTPSLNCYTLLVKLLKERGLHSMNARRLRYQVLS